MMDNIFVVESISHGDDGWVKREYSAPPVNGVYTPVDVEITTGEALSLLDGLEPFEVYRELGYIAYNVNGQPGRFPLPDFGEDGAEQLAADADLEATHDAAAERWGY